MATTTATEVSVQHGHVPELDLSALHLEPSVVDRFNETLPGFRTSAAFFTFLRANLVELAMSSASSPQSELQRTAFGLSLHTPSLLSTTSSSPSAAPSSRASSVKAPSIRIGSSRAPSEIDTSSSILPKLCIAPISSPSRKAAALRLLAASLSEDRAAANRRLVRHPLAVLSLSVFLTITYHFMPSHDLGSLLIVFSGILAAYLSLAQYLTAGLESIATLSMKPSFLLKNVTTGEEDLVLGAMWGKTLIGALVLRIEAHATLPGPTIGNISNSNSGGGKRHHHHRSRGSIGSLKSLQRRGGKGVIRAWTVAEKYRGQGVGGDLLWEAVRTAREKLGKDTELGFAREHAHATRVLPEWLDGDIRRREVRAGFALRNILREWETRGRRK